MAEEAQTLTDEVYPQARDCREPGRFPVQVGTVYGPPGSPPALTVDPDSSVLVWDEVMEGWTRCHSVPAARQEQARAIARDVWAGRYRHGPLGVLVLAPPEPDGQRDPEAAA